MKRNPTLIEKKQLGRLGLDPSAWLVRKNMPSGIELEHKYTGQRKQIPRSQVK